MLMMLLVGDLTLPASMVYFRAKDHCISALILKSFCLEMTHVSLAQISLAQESHISTPKLKGAGTYNPTMCQKEGN